MSRADLAAQARTNGNEVKYGRLLGPAFLPTFRDKVKNGGPWDYKQYDRRFEDFGNYNYGYTGAAAGIDRGLLLRQAGRAQVAAGTSKPWWGNPGLGGIVGGEAPYGDDPNDQYWINRGFDDFYGGC